MTNVISLSDKRPDVFWTVRMQQGWDGHMSVFVEDISSDPETRRRAAEAMRKAADLIEFGSPDAV